MTLQEKMSIVVKEFLLMNETEKRYIRRNMNKEYASLDARGTIKILRMQTLLASKGAYLSAEVIWFFLKVFTMNNFINGTVLFGTAMKKMSNKYSSIERRLESIVNQKSMENSYTQTVLLRQIGFLNSEKISLDLESLFTDILLWNNENKVTQLKWINQYI